MKRVLILATDETAVEIARNALTFHGVYNIQVVLEQEPEPREREEPGIDMGPAPRGMVRALAPPSREAPGERTNWRMKTMEWLRKRKRPASVQDMFLALGGSSKSHTTRTIDALLREGQIAIVDRTPRGAARYLPVENAGPVAHAPTPSGRGRHKKQWVPDLTSGNGLKYVEWARAQPKRFSSMEMRAGVHVYANSSGHEKVLQQMVKEGLLVQAGRMPGTGSPRGYIWHEHVVNAASQIPHGLPFAPVIGEGDSEREPDRVMVP